MATFDSKSYIYTPIQNIQLVVTGHERTDTPRDWRVPVSDSPGDTEKYLWDTPCGLSNKFN